MQVNVQLKPVTCNGAGLQDASLSTDGSITANVALGKPPYTYLQTSGVL